jgi:hypothetical protein
MDTAEGQAPASTAGRETFVKSAPTSAPAKVKPIDVWAKDKRVSDWDLAGLRLESFFNATNAEATEEQFDAALSKFRATPVGYQTHGMKR